MNNRAAGLGCYRACLPLHYKDPVGSRESASSTGNGVDLRDSEENVAKAGASRRRIRRSAQGRKRRIDGVSIFRHPMD